MRFHCRIPSFALYAVMAATTLAAQAAPAVPAASAESVAPAAGVAVPERTLVSKPARVTVYSDRAIVERAARIDLPAGRSSLLFDSLPASVDPSSLQVKASGSGASSVILEDIVFKPLYFSAVPDDRIAALTSQRDQIALKIQTADDRVNRAVAEKGFLEKIVSKVTSSVEGQASELNPDKWVQMIKFYREKLQALDEEIRSTEQDRAKQRAELDRVNRELSNLSSGRQKVRNQAFILVNAGKAASLEVVLSYSVAGPSWQSTYDLRVNSDKKSMEIGYNALITQNSGEDWTGVELWLSTARPEIGAVQPELEPWYLRVYKPYAFANRAGGGLMKSAPAPAAQMFNRMEQKLDVAEAVQEEAASMAAPEAVARTGALSVLFGIAGRTDIASDGVQHRVSIAVKSFDASFRYSTAPKLSAYAYLKAKTRNVSDIPFLPGPAKVFLDGAYVASSGLDLVAPGEEFWTFLGADESVKIDYKLVKKTRDDQGSFFDKKNRFTYQYETIVTNTRKSDVELVLWDQLPVATDQKIAVKLVEPKYQKDSDSLKKDNQDIFEWLLNLKPGEKRVVPFSFTVEYPQDMSVEGL